MNQSRLRQTESEGEGEGDIMKFKCDIMGKGTEREGERGVRQRISRHSVALATTPKVAATTATTSTNNSNNFQFSFSFSNGYGFQVKVVK